MRIFVRYKSFKVMRKTSKKKYKASLLRCKVSTKELARIIGVKTIKPCEPTVANKHTGYLVGGTSPFGVRRKMPVYMEETILNLPKAYINGGKRGFLVALNPQDLKKLLNPVLVKVGLAPKVGHEDRCCY